ncbi:tripartite tricarboxylate transporter substrate binding protein [Rhodovulum sp. FJ3]|uniref:Bug family tripartite tricarboxylate transporter substrate binding protein n=1 Tax=Rhodovulum sp. FJ3 TaxID=3079053 RepID=UPI00293DCEE0|nr:tripartite tricarboxylate transporter substrate binding protein [Rhodovulum sp. FJ3]MDV4167349.1 tripartite tricarboxylate transporter substrate binding protein [Rhodovulum sp. FJ3]
MKKLIAGLAVALATGTGAMAADFPAKEIQGIIQWGAGGSTDTVMRAVTPHAAEALGGTIVMQNKTGGVGAIALRHVQQQDSDGYTLLMGAENPQMYKVLGLGTDDYTDMVPINVLARGVPMFVANNDAPYNTMTEFVEYAMANPGEVRVGSTGPGGLTSIVLAMLTSQADVEFTRVPYDGDGPALTALQGGAIDVMPAVLGAAIEGVKAGRMKVIGLVDTQPNDLLPGVAPITEELPGFSAYLPWGPFFGVFVKKGTPDDVVAALQAAYAEGAKHPDFVQLMADRGFSIMSLSGDEAMDFLEGYRSTSSWLVHDAGFSKKSPEDFGIPRP